MKALIGKYYKTFKAAEKAYFKMAKWMQDNHSVVEFQHNVRGRGKNPTSRKCFLIVGNEQIKRNVPLKEFGCYGSGGSPSSKDDFAYSRGKRLGLLGSEDRITWPKFSYQKRKEGLSTKEISEAWRQYKLRKGL